MRNSQTPIPYGKHELDEEDIEAVVASMKAAGVNFRNEILSGVGGKQIIAENPSGNPIEVFQPA